MTDPRARLRMSDAEVRAFVDSSRRVHVGTHNPDGSIHLVPMSFLLWEGKIALWTDPQSQKVRNLRRDPRIACLLEDGDGFEDFRAVQIRGRADVIDDLEMSRRAGELLLQRSTGELTDKARGYAAMLAAQRSLVVVNPERVVSWDHHKISLVRPDQIGS